MRVEAWLVAWIGSADLRAAGVSPSTESGDSEVGVSQRANRDATPPERIGPIAKALLTTERFNKVYLLTNYDATLSRRYCKWLEDLCGYAEDQVLLFDIELPNPTAYAAIYEQVSANLKSARLPRDDVHLTFHLSPGTPAMTSIWILLAKTRFPARLIQTSDVSGVEEVDFFTSLADDFLPEFMRRNSVRMEKLAEGPHPSDPAFDDISHVSAAMRSQIEMARRVSVYNVPVLLLGETGTGKEVLAKAIHAASPRRFKPLIPINCGALTPELANSELFGHKRGAFTGAERDRLGAFQTAEGGTLFLDEIGDLPGESQVRLLRALQEKEVTPLGSSIPVKVDVRIIAATHRDLGSEIAAGRFREDLFHRLAVGVIRLPALRDRAQDIDLITEELLEKINSEARGKPEGIEKKLSPDARAFINAQQWTGNVRELYHTLVRAHLWSSYEVIYAEDIEAALITISRDNNGILNKPMSQGFSLQTILDQVSIHYINRALTWAGGKKTAAASILGMGNHQTLTNWMKRLGLTDSSDAVSQRTTK